MSLPRHTWDLYTRKRRAQYGEKIDSDRNRFSERRHTFTIFRMGLDVCAVCKKTWREHQTS
jgi:hypothetical protein